MSKEVTVEDIEALRDTLDRAKVDEAMYVDMPELVHRRLVARCRELGRPLPYRVQEHRDGFVRLKRVAKGDMSS